MKIPIKLVLFDFDGTIADSLLLGIDCYNKVIQNSWIFKGLNKIKTNDIEELKELSYLEIFSKLNVRKYQLGLLAFFITRLYNQRIDEVRPIDGITQVLRDLHRLNINFGVATSNNIKNVKRFLANVKIEVPPLMTGGGAIFGKHKLINQLINKSGLERSNIIYVGDEPRDILAARQSGIRVIGVVWGYGSKIKMIEAKPDWIINKPKDILDILTSQNS